MAQKYATIDDADEYKATNTAEAERIMSSANSKVDGLRTQQQKLSAEIAALNNDILLASTTVYVSEMATSEECKDKLSILRLKQAETIKNGKALKIVSSDPKKMLNNNVKQILRSFNAETNIIIADVTAKNVDTLRTKLQKSFEQLNKIFETDGVALSHVYLEMKFEELGLLYQYEVKREQEREEQKAIREQMLEEEKVRREIEKELIKIEKEETQFRTEISKLMVYMQKGSEVEKQLYIDKIHELEARLALVQKDKENALQREQNTRAGFVYIISNIGSFGEDIYKIGMTRRLEPMDRIKELGDASVPFEFDVHAMIFSEDAPALETTLHQTFRGREVNKVNLRKEFFRVSLDEIESTVKENYNATVTFTKIAEAQQYRASLTMATV